MRSATSCRGSARRTDPVSLKCVACIADRIVGKKVGDVPGVAARSPDAVTVHDGHAVCGHHLAQRLADLQAQLQAQRAAIEEARRNELQRLADERAKKLAAEEAPNGPAVEM